MVELFALRNRDIKTVNVVRWNPHVAGILAIGCSNGSIYVLNTISKSHKLLQVKERTLEVVDMQWDKLSSIYMLVAYENFISLWDTDTAVEAHVFEKQGTGVSSIAWMHWTAGKSVSFMYQISEYVLIVIANVNALSYH